MIIYLVIHFICALLAIWFAVRIEYDDFGCLHKSMFVDVIIPSVLLGPIAMLVSAGVYLDHYFDNHYSEEIHILDRFFKKEGKDD